MDELIGFIEAYTTKKGNSLTKLSKEANVNYSTLKRIASKEVTNPDFSNVLQIITVVCNIEDAKTFLRKYYPSESFCFRELNKDYGVSDKNHNDQLKDPIGFLLIHMGFAKSGTTRSDIATKAGAIGLEKLDELLNLGILTEINGRIKTAKDFKCADATTALESHRLATNYFTISNLGDHMSLIGFQCDGFSEWGLKQLYEIEKKKIALVAEIQNDPRGKGDNIAFVGTLFNRLDKEVRP